MQALRNWYESLRRSSPRLILTLTVMVAETIALGILSLPSVVAALGMAP